MPEEEKIETTFSRIFTPTNDIFRSTLERIMQRNILLYIGEQYLSYYASAMTFKRKKMAPNTPTPVCNIIRDYVRSMSALILNKEYAIKIWPNSNSQEDQDAALIGEKLLRSMDVQNDEEFKEERDLLTMWMLIAGTGFMRTFPMLNRGEYGIDKKGEFIASGEVVSQNVIPFNVLVDLHGDTLRKKRWIGIKSLKPIEWAEDTFHVKISPGDDQQLSYQKRLMKLIGDVSPWKSKGIESSSFDQDDDEMCVFKELEFKPTKKYPNGRYAVIAGDTLIMDVKRMPIPVEKSSWYYTLTDFHYLNVPGRFWSDSGINDLVSAQLSINEIDQALAVNRKGLGRPLVTIPIGPGAIALEKLSESGQHLLAIKYDPRTSAGQAPKIDRGTPLPDQILKERELHQQTAQNSAGDPRHVLSGQAPSSQSSGILVDILQNAAERGHVPNIKKYYRSLKRVYRKRLILAKYLYTEERIIKIAEEDNISVMSFVGADLRGNTDIRLEISSGISSTKTGQASQVMQLAQHGFFGDLTLDHEMRDRLMKIIGLSTFSNKLDLDLRRAQQENNKIMHGQYEDMMLVDQGEVMNLDPLFKYDKHAIHYEVHRKFILSNDFVRMSKELQTIAINHCDLHHDLMVGEQQAQMQQQMEQKLAISGRTNQQKISEMPTLGMEEMPIEESSFEGEV